MLRPKTSWTHWVTQGTMPPKRPTIFLLCKNTFQDKLVYILRHASYQNATFFGSCAPRQGAMTPKFELGRDFCTMRLPQVSSSYV